MPVRMMVSEISSIYIRKIAYHHVSVTPTRYNFLEMMNTPGNGFQTIELQAQVLFFFLSVVSKTRFK